MRHHGTDAGQPGGSPAFTIEVTSDMCAEIAACSGSLTKRGPVYIWDAPIDDWARVAADVATDFVPGVSQAKAAYDAYQRIQSGEDPLDVLMAAGGEAALGLIPGLKAGNKARKALGKADDVADAAGDLRRAATGGKHNAPRSSLPRAENGDYLPSPNAAGRSHTVLGVREGRRGSYTQGATFDAKGEFKGVTDVTTHGRGHPNPHFHPAKRSNSIEHGPHPLPTPEGF